MYIDIVPNRKSRPAVLLREAWREGKKIRKRTIANLSSWPKEKVEALRCLLKGDRMVVAEEAFAIEQSIPHGHVEAVLGTIRKIGLDRILASKGCRERDLVLAMIIERILHPCSKLATTRLWHTSTLAEELLVSDADEDDLYEAMDWLLIRQGRIERKLAARHLFEGSLVLYDVSSSYYEGHTCPLARFGHNRDRKKGKPIIVYGLLTDEAGRPVSVQVFPGDTGDPTTVPDQAHKLRESFHLEHLVLVGDLSAGQAGRGMLTQVQIDKLKEYPGLGWVSALRSGSIRKLVHSGMLQMSLFDKQDLAEIRSPLFPGERLVACFNPLLAEERRRKRDDLLAVTEKELEKIARTVSRRTKSPLDKAEIGRKVGRVIHRFKMAKHFVLTIEDGFFSFARNQESIRREEDLDGIYVIRTNEPAERISTEEVVRSYKRLGQVEQAFRCMKGIDLRVRPIHHRTEDHVRAHIFLCMLAYYVEWHMRKALAPLLFDDEELDELRKLRDPVKPAKPSSTARVKKASRRTPDGLAIQSFNTLLAQLSTRCRNRCRVKLEPNSPTFVQTTEPNPFQIRALQLLGLYPVKRKSLS